MTGNGTPWDEPAAAVLRATLLAFFDRGARDLPWRDTQDAYRILVSEVMLQQTRVDVVVPYYRRWMERFPNLEALAEAETEEVLRVWQGLGYYSRARNLHRAAREIVAGAGGRIPSDEASLRKLPGVGPYTAAAVASIAFGKPVPAVDGNVRRVLARLADAPAPTPAELARWAGRLLDSRRPGDFNQALMELGALVCTPRRPACDRCPVADGCAARGAGTVADRPAPRRRAPLPRTVEATAVVVRQSPAGPEVLLRRRPEEGLLGGLWECPGSAVSDGACAAETATRLATALLGAGVTLPEALPLPPLDHAFSHRAMTYRPHLYRLGGRPDAAGQERDLRWVGFGRLRELPLPAAQKRVLERARPWVGCSGGAGRDAAERAFG